MRRHYILAVMVAGIALTAAGCSARRDYRNYYPGDRYQRSSYGYDYERVRELAGELERTTHSLKESVKDQGYYRSRSQDYLIDKLKDLDHEAEHFSREVDHERNLRKTEDDFRDLSKRYYDARNALQSVSGYGSYSYFYRDVERVSRIMNELSRYYGSGYNDPSYRRY
jgi:hypothetical protein